jgi:hypothetical protein
VPCGASPAAPSVVIVARARVFCMEIPMRVPTVMVIRVVLVPVVEALIVRTLMRPVAVVVELSVLGVITSVLVIFVICEAGRGGCYY